MQKIVTQKKHYPSDENLTTAIIVCTRPGNIGSPFKKYRNIPRQGAGRQNFLLKAAKVPGISHINFYEKKHSTGPGKGKFIEQIRF